MKHSKAGIASFVIGVLVAILWVTNATLGLGTLGFWLIMIAGWILGFIGIFSPGTKKIFAVLGIIVPLAPIVLLMLFLLMGGGI